VALASAEAEAVVRHQVATAVGRAMLSATSKISHRTKALLQVLADPSHLKALLHLSARTATLPLPHTLALNDLRPTAKPFPILPQDPVPVFLLLLAMHLHPTAAQLSHQSPQVPAMPITTTMLYHLGLQATDVANQRSTTPILVKPPVSTAASILPSVTSLKSFLEAAKLHPRSTALVSTSLTKSPRSCVARSRRKRLRSGRRCGTGNACPGRVRLRVSGVNWQKRH
jgi:hypothetical protein